MRKILVAVCISIASIVMVGCGGSFEVPPAHVGKIIDSNGFSKELIETGRKRFYVPDFGGGRDMILLSTATKTPTEPLSMKLSDDLTLGFSVRSRISVKNEPAILNGVFGNIEPTTQNINGDHYRVITLSQLYGIYAQMEIVEQARRVVSGYTIEDIQENYGRISSEIYQSVVTAIEGTPLRLESLTMVNIDYPDVVDDSIEAVKKRDLAILQEEAEVQRRLVEARGDLEVAKANREVELTRASTERDSNKIIGEGVTPEFLALRQLEAQMEMAQNKNTVFMPFEALNSVGAQTRMFSEQK